MKAILVGFLLIMAIGSVMAGPPSTLPEQLLEHYYSIQKSLASDSINGVAAAAAQLAKIGRQAAGAEPQAKATLLALADAATKFQAADLKSARGGFGELSDRMIAFLQAAGAKRNPPYQFYCSMVKKNWMQPDKATRNPYYGSEMLTCGELIQPKPVEQQMEHNHH
jgi:membrane fusion protein, copper/silver efflux system